MHFPCDSCFLDLKMGLFSWQFPGMRFFFQHSRENKIKGWALGHRTGSFWFVLQGSETTSATCQPPWAFRCLSTACLVYSPNR